MIPLQIFDLSSLKYNKKKQVRLVRNIKKEGDQEPDEYRRILKSILNEERLFSFKKPN
jgi:hypothetical protein